MSALGANGGESPFPTRMLPNDTFTSRFRSMYVNDDAVQVIRQTGAHSDSDVMVLFRKADVIATGDVLDLRQFPVIDAREGGGIDGELEALNRLLTEFVVPNMPLVLKPAGRSSCPARLRLGLRRGRRVSRHGDGDQGHHQGTGRQGLTLEQVKAANPTRGYRGRYGKDSGPWTTDMFVEAVFKGLNNPVAVDHTESSNVAARRSLRFADLVASRAGAGKRRPAVQELNASG